MSARPRKRLQRTPRTVIRFQCSRHERAARKLVGRNELGHGALVMLGYLYGVMVGGSTYTVQPAQLTIAQAVGRGDRHTIRRYSAELVAVGLIELTRGKNIRVGDRWRRAHTTRYRLNLDRVEQVLSGKSPGRSHVASAGPVVTKRQEKSRFAPLGSGRGGSEPPAHALLTDSERLAGLAAIAAIRQKLDERPL